MGKTQQSLIFVDGRITYALNYFTITANERDERIIHEIK